MVAPIAMDLLDMAGVLYVVATPIGNLEDFSRRGAEVLGSVAMIAAEDTRRTRVLLEAIGVSGTQVLALHSHNETAASDLVMARLRQGAAVALVSDAGTPLLSDPGFELVRACWEDGIPVLPVPGASAVAAVLSVSPLPGARFMFEGFLPAKPAGREERLRALLEVGAAVVFFEAPHRMAATLEDLERLAPERRVVIGREMTKRHEQYLCDRPGELLRVLTAGAQLKGEFVCVLEGGKSDATPEDVRRTMETLVRELSPTQAARIGAQLLGRSRRELYDLAVSLRDA
jgi:16S rRNA (cytidine1402-2'-O)-methyltransferase